jgi:hypothetical protein
MHCLAVAEEHLGVLADEQWVLDSRISGGDGLGTQVLLVNPRGIGADTQGAEQRPRVLVGGETVGEVDESNADGSSLAAR